MSDRRSAYTVETTAGGGVQLTVTHADPRVEGWTSGYATGLEMPPAVWRAVIAAVQEKLPAEGTPEPAVYDEFDAVG